MTTQPVRPAGKGFHICMTDRRQAVFELLERAPPEGLALADLMKALAPRWSDQDIRTVLKVARKARMILLTGQRRAGRWHLAGPGEAWLAGIRAGTLPEVSRVDHAAVALAARQARAAEDNIVPAATGPARTVHLSEPEIDIDDSGALCIANAEHRRVLRLSPSTTKHLLRWVFSHAATGIQPSQARPGH